MPPSFISILKSKYKCFTVHGVSLLSTLPLFNVTKSVASHLPFLNTKVQILYLWWIWNSNTNTSPLHKRHPNWNDAVWFHKTHPWNTSICKVLSAKFLLAWNRSEGYISGKLNQPLVVKNTGNVQPNLYLWRFPARPRAVRGGKVDLHLNVEAEGWRSTQQRRTSPRKLREEKGQHLLCSACLPEPVRALSVSVFSSVIWRVGLWTWLLNKKSLMFSTNTMMLDSTVRIKGLIRTNIACDSKKMNCREKPNYHTFSFYMVFK